MAQTTGAFFGGNAVIEFSTNGSSWTNISGSSSSIVAGEQARQTGDAYTLDGDTAIVTGGKREPLDVEVNLIYTETAGEGWELVRAAFEAGTMSYVRFSPKGGAIGTFRFTSAAGVISSITYPPSESEEAGPVMVAFNLRTPSLTKSTITS